MSPREGGVLSARTDQISMEREHSECPAVSGGERNHLRVKSGHGSAGGYSLRRTG